MSTPVVDAIEQRMARSGSTRPGRGSLRLIRRVRRFARRRLVLAGSLLVLLEILLAVLAPLLAPFPPNTQDFRSLLQPPGGAHILGTDDLGRDILSRLLF